LVVITDREGPRPFTHPTSAGVSSRAPSPAPRFNAKNPTTGLAVRADLDLNEYPTKIKLTKQQKVAIPIRRHEFHGDWNYTIGRQADR
jgi:Rhodopirellula transposase DDE domain